MTRAAKPHRRGAVDRYAKLHFSLLNSDAFLGLKPAARALLIQFAARIWPDNNGKVFISVRDAAAMMGALDHHTASNALRDLADHGFIQEVEKGTFKRKASVNGDSRATVWRATWIPIAGKEAATNEFQNWRAPKQTQTQKRVSAGREVLLRWRISPETVEDSNTVSDTHIAKQIPHWGDFTTADDEKSIVSMGDCDEDSDTHEVSIPCTPLQRPVAAPSSLCRQARVQATSWLANTGTRQCDLAKLAGLSASKLSRFLNRPEATLNREQLGRLREAMAPHYQFHQSKKLSAR